MTTSIRLTKGVVSHEEAKRIAPDYYHAVVNHDGDALFANVVPKFDQLKRGQKVLTYTLEGQFVVCRVTSINHNDYRAIDGPVVRVSNGEYSWRVDGAKYGYPIS